MSSTTLIFDGWNPTHQNGDERGMVYGIAIPTLYDSNPTILLMKPAESQQPNDFSTTMDHVDPFCPHNALNKWSMYLFKCIYIYTVYVSNNRFKSYS